METFGIVGVAYNGYGRYIERFLDSIEKSSVKPDVVTIVLGDNHGWDKRTKLVHKFPISFQEAKGGNIGVLSNIGIKETPTEWIMPIDIDDVVTTGGLEKIRKYTKNYDYIACGWRSIYGKRIKYRNSVLPVDITMMDTEQRQKKQINNNSPFRKTFWEMHNYQEVTWVNIPFIPDIVEEGARFMNLRYPCFDYLIHLDSVFNSMEYRRQRPLWRKAVEDMVFRLHKYYCNE